MKIKTMSSDDEGDDEAFGVQGVKGKRHLRCPSERNWTLRKRRQ